MKKIVFLRSSFHLACFSAVFVGMLPQQVKADAPQQLDLSSLPADVVSDVVIPVPGEVFAAMDSAGEQNWQSALIERDVLANLEPKQNRTETGLLFGLVVTNGFLAVQAEDLEAVQMTGEKVLALADALGVKDEVLPHAQAIIQYAEEEEWGAVRRELDRVEQSVKRALNDLADGEVGQLISLGGWIGGTDAMLMLMEEEFSEDGAELLQQPDLAGALVEKIDLMSEERRNEEMIVRIRRSLSELEPLMREVPLQQNQLDEMSELTQPIVHALRAN